MALSVINFLYLLYWLNFAHYRVLGEEEDTSTTSLTSLHNGIESSTTPAINSSSAPSPSSSSSSALCRTVFSSTVYYCPQEAYDLFTSLTCYFYLPSYVIPAEKKWFPCLGYRHKHVDCIIHVCRRDANNTLVIAKSQDYDINDERSLIYTSFDTDRHKWLWRECHAAASRCCRDMLSKPPSPDPTDCPRTWDSWHCFDDAPAGGFTETDCPNHIYFRSEPSSCARRMRKYCTENGSRWESNEDFPNGEWTNYSACLDLDTVKVRHYTHIWAYGVSLIALAPALFIFYAYKQLRVPRITMHKNLFISIFINGIVFIVFKKIIVLGELEQGNQEDVSSIARENSDGCKFLFVLTKYTRATNYMWMLCEGFYLHKLIVAAFAEQKQLFMYYLIGWGFPLVPIIIYSILRATDDVANERCWTFPVEKYEWIVNGPNLLSLVINFLFLCNIIRVLVTKLRATHTNEPSQYRKAVRATLVLVPLFGLHFVLTIYRPAQGPCNWLEAYFYVNYLLDGLQGFLVALIFCYFNGEVIYLMKRSLYRWRLRNMPHKRTSNGNSTQMTSLVKTMCQQRKDSSNEDNLSSPPQHHRHHHQDSSPCLS